MRTLLVATSSPLLIASVALAATDFATWNGPFDGLWNVAASWIPGIVPLNGDGKTYAVTVAPPGGNAVRFNVSGAIDTLTIDADHQVKINNGITMSIAGGLIDGQGTLLLNGTASVTTLRLDADTLLGGGATITSSATNGNRLFGAGPETRLTIGPDAALLPVGMTLGLDQLRLTNLGLVETIGSTTLTMDLTDGPGNFNSGLIRSAPGSALTLLNITLDNAGGTIAAGPGTLLSLNNCRVESGTLHDEDGADGPGAIRTIGTTFLRDVTVLGDYQFGNATTTVLEGAPSINGRLRMLATGGTATLRIETTPMVLGGTGSIECSSSLGNRIIGLTSATELVVPQTQSIRGSLLLGLDQLVLHNFGLIESENSMTIDLTDGPVNSNAGVIRTAPGAVLTITDTTIDNDGGEIAAGPGTSVFIASSRIENGTLRDEDGEGGPGRVRTSGTSFYRDVTFEGEHLTPNGQTTVLEGAPVVNGLLLLQASGSVTTLRIDTTPLVLAGAGSIQCSDTTANRILGPTASTELIVPAEMTIRGGLSLGVDQLQLSNVGLIQAEGVAGMTIDLTDLADGPGNSNQGVIRTATGSKMTITDTSLDNDGGVIAAGPGTTVTLSGARIEGGLLDDEDGVAGPGNFRTNLSTVLRGITLQGNCIVPNGTTTILEGDPVIEGRLELQANASTTSLRVDTSPMTISGAGEIRFSNSSPNRLFGVAPDTTLTFGPDLTLRGGGSVGINQLQLRNEGSMLADVSTTLAIDCSDIGIGFQNAGLLRAQNGDVTIAAGPFENSGAVRIDVGRTLTRSGGTYLQTAGLTKVDGVLSATVGTTLQGGVLAGTGSITGSVSNTGGTVSPGASAGTLSISQGYIQGAGGALEIEIGGLTPAASDRLAVTGAANLDGTLLITRINGFVPDPDDLFTILTAASRAGTFHTVLSEDRVEVVYEGNAVKIRFLGSSAIPGDLNDDGIVNGADLGLLLSAWGVCAEPICPADLNGDGVVDGADLGILLANFT